MPKYLSIYILECQKTAIFTDIIPTASRQYEACLDQTYQKLNNPQRMSDSVYFGDMMRTLHKILAELESMNKKLDKINPKSP